jgi:hypothetical protein
VAWSALGLVVTAGLAGWLVPRMDAGRMRRPLTVALEQMLGRHVEFGEVRYQVFPTPGLSARDLVIPDDRAFGLEPLAYVGEMQAGVSFVSLFTGELSISSVRLVEASVNLARKDEGGWNFAALLERVFAGVKKTGSGPSVQMRESRINFRTGTLKSALYLNAVDVDLEPPAAPGGDLRWRYEASPARTDRAEQGFGRFTGSGRWTPSGGGPGRLAVDLELERSAIGELLTLITGSDLGVQGRFTSRATLDGPLEQLRIRGSVELADVNRTSLFGLRAKEYSLPYQGSLDLTAQTLSLNSGKPEGEKAPLPLNITLLCRRMLADPLWEAALTFEAIPAPALLDLAQRLGARTPPGLTLEGELAGSLKYSQAEPAGGSVMLKHGRVAVGGSAPLSVEEAQIALAGSKLTLAPARFTTEDAAEAVVSGSWDLQTEALGFELKTDRLPLNHLRAGAERLNIAPPELLGGTCTDGEVSGTLRFERAAETSDALEEPERESWSGELGLSKTACALEGSPQPVRLETATLALRNGGWALRRVSGSHGGRRFTGEVRHLPGQSRPWHFSVSLPEASGAEIDAFFQSALLPPRGLLDRTLRRRAVMPAWLRARHAEGHLQIGRLAAGGAEFSAVKAHLFWDGGQMDLPELAARWEAASFSGRASVGLGAERLRYRLLGRLDGVSAASGTFDAELDLTTPALGGPLAGVLSGTAQVSGRNLEFGAEKARQMNACLDYDGARTGQRLKFTCLEAQLGGEWISGHVSPAAEGRLHAEFATAHDALHLGITLTPPSVAAIQAPAQR